MIEMQWVKVKFTGDNEAVMRKLAKAANVYGAPHVLQFRDVIERREDGSVRVATNWQDVEIAGEAT